MDNKKFRDKITDVLRSLEENGVIYKNIVYNNTFILFKRVLKHLKP